MVLPPRADPPRTDSPLPRQQASSGRAAFAPALPQPRATAPRPVYAVSLAVETTDPTTGVRHRRLVVEDESDDSPTRDACQQAFAEQDRVLRAHPDWPATEVVDGELVLPHGPAQWFYTSAAMREWRRELVPRASALYPVQRPFEPRLPSGGLVDSTARSIFLDCWDSIGIRTRARVMADVVRRCAAAAGPAPAEATASWVSLACGAAVPVLDALESMDPGATTHLQLVDLDEQALDFARELAEQRDLVEGRDFTLLRRDLVSGIVARATLVDELGEGSADVVDAVGIFEYFRDAACARLLRNAYRLLRPGGVLVVANMLADRPELDVNQRAIGWPRLYPRSVDDLLALVARAGLPLDRTTVSIPADGVYAVVDITR